MHSSRCCSRSVGSARGAGVLPGAGSLRTGGGNAQNRSRSPPSSGLRISINSRNSYFSMSSPLSRSHLGSASPLLVTSYRVMSGWIPLSDVQENPWLPSASVGEARDALQGTVENWLARQHPTAVIDDRDHGADFLRAAVEQFDCQQVTPVFQDFARGLLGGECSDDSAALTWLWINTESGDKNRMAALIVELAREWRPCVQSPDFSSQVLQRKLDALEEVVRAAERSSMQSAMAGGPHFDCADAREPAVDDFLEDDDLEDPPGH